jgi:excisionase family DNA binding protein
MTGTRVKAKYDEGAAIAVSIPEAASRLRISRTLMYKLVLAKQVRSVKIGRSRRIPVNAITDYIAKLERKA